MAANGGVEVFVSTVTPSVSQSLSQSVSSSVGLTVQQKEMPLSGYISPRWQQAMSSRSGEIIDTHRYKWSTL